jgi:Bacterial Ig-like domain (group 3)
MRNPIRRTLAATAVAAMSGALLLAAPSNAFAFDAGALSSVVNSAGGTTSGTNNDVVQVTAPAACDAAATRQVLKFTAVTATVPAQQAAADLWVGDNLYSPTGVGLPGPITAQASNTFQGLADNATGGPQQLVPGVYHFVLRCQDNLGGTIFQEWNGGVVFSSPTAWTGFVGPNPPAPPVATTTTLTAAPSPATDSQTITLTATVNESATGTPTGNVQFFDGATSLGTSAVNGSAVATLTAGPLAAGSHTLRAVYAGDSAFLTSQGTTPLTVTGTVVPASNTATVLTVAPTSGPAFQSVTAQGVVTDTTPPAVTPVGNCSFLDGAALLGTSPVNASGVCTFTSTSFQGPGHSFTIHFVATDPTLWNPSTSNIVTAAYDAPTFLPDDQTVVVTVPAGTLTIFTPYTPTNPLVMPDMTLSADGTTFSSAAGFDHVTVTDTRAGNPGWTASLTRNDFVGASPANTIPAKYSGFVGVAPSYLPGNAIHTGDVVPTDLPANDPGYTSGPHAFATTAAGHGTGSVNITGNFVLVGVPSSTAPGLYTATVTFTIA